MKYTVLKDYNILLIVCIITLISCIGYKYKGAKFKSSEHFKNSASIKNAFIFETEKGPIQLANPYRGIYIQGGAGSGKSASLFEPIISQLPAQGFTGILYDFKSPELTDKLLTVYQNQTQIKTYNIDFKNPYISNRINPLEPTRMLKSSFAIEYATTLINNLLPETVKKPGEFFSSNAKMVLAGCIWYLKTHHAQYCTLPHLISLVLHNDSDNLIQQISFDRESGGMVASLKQAIDRGAERQSAGVMATLQNALSTLNTQDIFWILSKNDMDLQLNNPEHPSFLCVGNDSTLSATYAPVISLIISVCLRQMNQPNQQKSIVLLDEAPTLYIPNIEQLPAVARSNKIATVFGVQDFSQLVDKYGEDKAGVIVSNLGNQFYGRVVNPKTAETITKMFSKEDRTFKTKNKGFGSSGEFIHLSTNDNSGVSENIQERDRVKVSDITHLSSGQFYGIIAEGSPKEFLKTQFKPFEIVPNVREKQVVTSDIKMRENYEKIVREAATILNDDKKEEEIQYIK